MTRDQARLRPPWIVPQTIRLRLTLWYLLLLTLILLGFSVFLYTSLRRNLHIGMDRALEDEVPQLIDALDLDEKRPELEDLDDVPDGLVVALYDHAGGRLIDSSSPQALPLPSEVLPQGSREAAGSVRLADGTWWRVLTVQLAGDDHAIGMLQIARSEQDIEAALDQLRVLMMLAVPLLLLLAITGGLFLADRALRPINRIADTAERIGVEDLSQRINLAASPDEVGRLATMFDRMLERLDQAFERQRQFTADASHELRTPLTLLISQGDVALERSRSAKEYRQVISSMREDAARMARLLDELLTLARADAGQHKLTLEMLVVNDLVDDVVAAMAPLAEARRIHLRGDTIARMTVEGDQARLTQLLVNLIDNGLKYTPAGGTVTVSVDHKDGWAELRVADTGVGIPSDHLPHVFERFYRVDTARARAEGGTGLGLSICEWIARAHGGDITVASGVGRGTTFTVRLPLGNRRASRVESELRQRETSLV